jgi:ppGpp synthetase/RelA/SpoT-type nucleotidyltranferase
MKILHSITTLYNAQYEINNKLKKKVDEIFRNNKSAKWHFESRIKSPESFALKIETGRFSKPKNLEDFFACLIVVENIDAIKEAISLVEKYFLIEFRKPPRSNYTHKQTDAFPFDDLRLYVKLNTDPGLPPQIYDGTTFEIQIKTFLQHAWSIATHDLIYKSDKISWPRQRLAYQIKAMLEHAEASIEGVENLCNVGSLNLNNKKIESLIDTKNLIIDLWEAVDLPKDLVRISQNVDKLISTLEISREELKQILISETTSGRGTKLKNLSPYMIIVQSLFNVESLKLKKFLALNKDYKKFKLIITPEITIPSFFNQIDENNLIRII